MNRILFQIYLFSLALSTTIHSKNQETPPATTAHTVTLEDKLIENQRRNSINIVVLELLGPIFDTRALVSQLKACLQNPDVQAVLLRIDSPGGAPGPAESLYREIINFKAIKPLVVLVENICASGGYMVACAANWIVVPAGSLIGSIGVIQKKFYFTNEDPVLTTGGSPAEDTLRGTAHQDSIYSGTFKQYGSSVFVPYNESERTVLQALCDRVYEDFITMVSAARSQLLKEHYLTWADGKIFTGSQAVEVGLADGVGSLTDALMKILELVRHRNSFGDKQINLCSIDPLMYGLSNLTQYTCAPKQPNKHNIVQLTLT